MSGRAIVVGSGPAGVACARALAERGREVTILDAGRGPDPAAAERYAPLVEGATADWDPALVERLRSEFGVSHDELPLKPVLGSLHPYAGDDPSAPPRAARSASSRPWGAVA